MNSLKIKANDISFIAMFVAFLCATNGELSNTSNVIIYYLPYVLCLGAYLLEILPKRKVVLPSYIIWRICILVILILSSLYAINSSSTTLPIKRYILQTFVVLLICEKCLGSRKNIVKLVKLLISSLVINTVYVFLTMDVLALGSGQRLGVSTINDAWNANNIGVMASFAIVFSIYYYMFIYDNRTVTGKVFFVCILAFFGVAVMLSGSRKALLLAFIVLFGYILQTSQSHIVRNIIIVLSAGSLGIYLLFNIPFFYDNIGYRFESFLLMLRGAGGDKSILGRQDMVEVGLRVFWDRPVLGYGINCFKDVYGAISGRVVYAHNNYIELLVDVGIVGVIIYYAYLFWMLFTSKCRIKSTMFIKSILLAILVCDYGMVSYYDGLVQYVLCIAVCILMKSKCNESDEINWPTQSRC